MTLFQNVLAETECMLVAMELHMKQLYRPRDKCFEEQYSFLTATPVVFSLEADSHSSTIRSNQKVLEPEESQLVHCWGCER